MLSTALTTPKTSATASSVPMRLTVLPAPSSIPWTRTVATQSATAMTPMRMGGEHPSIHQRLVHQRAQSRADRIGARWHELGEEQRDHACRGVDVERRAGHPAPGVLPLASEHLAGGRIGDGREAEPTL